MSPNWRKLSIFGSYWQEITNGQVLN